MPERRTHVRRAATRRGFRRKRCFPAEWILKRSAFQRKHALRGARRRACAPGTGGSGPVSYTHLPFPKPFGFIESPFPGFPVGGRLSGCIGFLVSGIDGKEKRLRRLACWNGMAQIRKGQIPRICPFLLLWNREEVCPLQLLSTRPRPARRRGRPPGAARRCPCASCAFCLPSAFRGACAYG